MSTEDNLFEVTSSPHFQDLLSKDLERVSLINFYAPWANACQQMNAVVSELAKKYPELLVLQVEGEQHEEIVESFEIQAVPTFLVLRGHTLLTRIDGADASKLTNEIAKRCGSKSAVAPRSTTTAQPAPPPPSSESKEAETQEQLNERMRSLMAQSRVVLFMKGNPDAPRCGFSRQMVGLLREQKVEFAHFDILTDESVRQGLKKLNDWPTFPQLIVDNEFVGGLDIVKEMVANREFQELVAKT